MNAVAWWRARSIGQRAAMVVVAVVVAVNAVTWVVNSVYGREPGGPTASSYATGPDGFGAFAQLLDAHGQAVTRIRTDLDKASLDPATTLVLADPDLIIGREYEAVRRFMEDGGHVVAIGATTLPVLRDLTGTRIGVEPVGPKRWRVLAPLPEAGAATQVSADGDLRFITPRSAQPFLGDRDAVTGFVHGVGSGVLVAIVDPSPFENRRLGDDGNAALALGVTGGRPVAFDEAAHGFTTGAGALPEAWTRALVMALLATLLAMWAVGRRLGPPEEGERPLPPPRRGYVDALAVALARTKDPAAAIEPLRRRAQERVASRLGLPADASRQDVEAAARRAGFDADDVAALYDEAHDDTDAVTIAAAAARLRGGAR